MILSTILTGFPKNIPHQDISCLESRAKELLKELIEQGSTPLTLDAFIGLYATRLRTKAKKGSSRKYFKKESFREVQESDFVGRDMGYSDNGDYDCDSDDDYDSCYGHSRKQDQSRAYIEDYGESVISAVDDVEFYDVSDFDDDYEAFTEKGFFARIPKKSHYLLILSNEILAMLHIDEAGDPDIKNYSIDILLERNEGIIRQVIRSKCKDITFERLEDYVQNAKMFIFMNMQSYSASRGAFNTFIQRHIFTSIDEQKAADNGHSLHIQRRITQFEREQARVQKDGESEVNINDMCDALGIGPRAYEQIKRAHQIANGFSLDGGTFNTLASPSNPEESFVRKSEEEFVRDSVRAAVLDLADYIGDNYEFVERVLWLSVTEDLTNKEMAERLNTTPSKVRQALKTAKSFLYHNPHLSFAKQDVTAEYRTVREAFVLTFSEAEAVGNYADEIAEDLLNDE